MSKKDQKSIHFYYLKLPEDDFYQDFALEAGRTLEQLGFINLFVGQNNSGKSRMLRKLFSDRSLPYRTSPEVNVKFELALNGLITFIDENYKHLYGKYDLPRLSTISKLDIGFFIPNHHPYERIRNFISKIKEEGSRIGSSDEVQAQRQEVSEFVEALADFMTKNFPEEYHEEKRFYIPILRGLRALPSIDIEGREEREKIPRIVYLEATTRDYFSKDRNASHFPNTVKNGQIFTGLELYNLLKNMLLGLPEQRERVKQYEEFLSRNFFNNNPVTLIPLEQDDVVHVKIGNDKQRPIFDLGDGLQSLIICTFNSFMEKDRCTFYIEEPDTYMHPGMQRAFLNALKENSQHQYFITTHSNHMLDMTLDYSDISVFKFRSIEKEGKASFCIQNSSSSDRNLLKELGVQNSSVFLTNATIWVEGLTDRLYLRAYMAKYLDELSKSEFPDDIKRYEKYSMFFEDTHYSFVEYQGSCLAHWIFDEDSVLDGINVKKLCADAIVIADGDVNNKPRAKRVMGELGEKFIVLDCKEIENLIPKSILQKVIPSVYKVNGADLEGLRYCDYSKSQDGMGEILSGIFSDGGDRVRTESGTVKKKSELCKAAVAKMSESTEWVITEPIKDLLEKVYRHIQENNK